MKLKLVINYPPTYPDVIPDLGLEEIEVDDEDDEDEEEDYGELLEGEEEEILDGLRTLVSRCQVAIILSFGQIVD